MKNTSLSKPQRILIVIKYLTARGAKKESVNNVYRKIIKGKYDTRRKIKVY